MITLSKPDYAAGFIGSAQHGDQLGVRGVPVKITARSVTIKVVGVTGCLTQVDYTDRHPWLVGQHVTVSRATCLLYRVGGKPQGGIYLD